MKKFLSLLICVAIVLFAFFALTERGGNMQELIENPMSYIIPTQPPQELTQIGSPSKFYYNELADIEKHAYNSILSKIYDMPENIDIPRINAVQLDDVFAALLYDNPDLFFVGRKCTLSTHPFRTSCSIEYIVEKEEYEIQKAELEKVCNKVLSSLSNPDDEWQTELEIHDYIVNNCEYKIVENELVYSSAYGVLVNGFAACEGYSKAAKLLLDKAGIENTVLSGISTSYDGTEGAHMWNAVKIYGDYYYLDCTWDDPVSDDGSQMKIYSYFNINNEMISASHSDFSHDFSCTATQANYYVKTGRFFETYDRSNEKDLADLIVKTLEEGEKAVEIRFGSESAYNDAVEDLIDCGRIYRVLKTASAKTDKKFSLNSLVYYKDSGLLTLTLIPECN